MYRWIRNLHLLLGAFTSLPLLIYGISAVQMAHPKWLPAAARETTTTLQLPVQAFGNARTLAARLVESYGLNGEMEESDVTAEHIDLTMFRPGVVHQVSYARQTGATSIKTRVNGLVATMNRLHHLSGVAHQGVAFNGWGWLLGLVSVALILIGASGIYLWFKLHAERTVGIILLTVNLGFSLTLIVLLRIP